MGRASAEVAPSAGPEVTAREGTALPATTVRVVGNGAWLPATSVTLPMRFTVTVSPPWTTGLWSTTSTVASAVPVQRVLPMVRAAPLTVAEKSTLLADVHFTGAENVPVTVAEPPVALTDRKLGAAVSTVTVRLTDDAVPNVSTARKVMVCGPLASALGTV